MRPHPKGWEGIAVRIAILFHILPAWPSSCLCPSSSLLLSHFRMSKLFCGKVVLLLVAFMAWDCEIIDRVGTAPWSGCEMFYFQRYVCLSTVHTISMELLKEIFPDLISLKFSLLVLYSTYLRVVRGIFSFLLMAWIPSCSSGWNGCSSFSV